MINLRLYSKIKRKLRHFYTRHSYHILSAGKASFGVIGHRRGQYPYKRLYLGSQEETTKQSFLHKGGTKLARHLIQNTGLVVLSDMPISDDLKPALLQVPSYVGLTIPLPATLDNYYSDLPGSARKDIQKIHKMGFSYEVSQDVSWTAEFYNRYYRPSMLNRFGEEGYVSSWQEVQTLAHQQHSEFIKVIADGQCIAAVLNQVNGKSYRFLRIGWIQSDNRLVKQGVIAALYWFSIQRAYQLQCNELFLGGTPPYLENGLLWFKAKWGGRLVGKSRDFSARYLLLDPTNPACYQFLENCSLLAYGAADSYMVLSSKLPNQFTLPTAFWKNIRSWYQLRTTYSPEASDENELPTMLQGWYEKIPLPHPAS